MEKSYPITINGQKRVVRQITIPFSSIDLLSWLDSQQLSPKVFWHCLKEEVAIAGVGSALSFHSIPLFEGELPSSARFFGGLSFSEKTWENFPEYFFFLPMIQLIQRKTSTELVFNCVDNSSPELKELKKLCLTPSQTNASLPRLLLREDRPLFSEWENNIMRYLKMIKEGHLEKIVCARCTTFSCDQRINPFVILEKIQKVAQRATLFAFQPDPQSTFIGASPERLYKRVGDKIRSDVIAGTRPKGSSSQEDEILKAELLSSRKEQHEFLVVKDDIRSQLLSFCDHLTEEASDQILTTTSVHHLYNSFSGILKNGITDKEIVQRLHPTPAIGGRPKEKVLSLLNTEEAFVRGWYAAPLGWIGPQEADFLVAIRSALIQEERIHLFAGAGIVEGSHPRKEWEELEYKMKAFTEVFS